MALEIRLGELFWIELTVAHFATHVPDGVLKFGASAVVDGEDESHRGVRCGLADGVFECEACGGGEVLEAADCAQLDVVLVEDGQFEGEEVFEEVEQCVDLFARAFPVLGGECEEREAFDAEFCASGGDGSHGACATAVAFHPR